MSSEKLAILIIGMHRSGTSALARTVALLGARLPNDLVEGNEGNPAGHWEPKAVVDLNDRMLVDAGSDVYGICEIGGDWFLSSKIDQFVDEAKRVLRASYEDDPVIVLKDPRTALLLPIWHKALADLGYRCVHILPLRHPSDVADSLRRRHLKTIPYDAWTQPRGELVWLRYTLASVLHTRGSARCFLNYADLLRDWRGAMSVVAKELGISWPSFDSSAEREIDRFLVDEQSGQRDLTELKGQNLTDLSLLSLTEVLYSTLQLRGDDEDRVDALQAEFSRRLGGTRDLVSMFEGLYALIWQYYIAAQQTRSSGVESHQDKQLRATFQQLWTNYTRVITENGCLQQDVATSHTRIRSLEMAQEELKAITNGSEHRNQEAGRHTESSTEESSEQNKSHDDVLAPRSLPSRSFTTVLRALLRHLRR